MKKLAVRKIGRQVCLESNATRHCSTDAQERTVSKLERISQELGVPLRFGTLVGEYPQTIILDYKYQDSAVSVSSNGSFEINGEEFGSYDSYFSFSRVNIDDVKDALLSLKSEAGESEESLTESDDVWSTPESAAKSLFDRGLVASDYVERACKRHGKDQNFAYEVGVIISQLIEEDEHLGESKSINEDKLVDKLKFKDTEYEGSRTATFSTGDDFIVTVDESTEDDGEVYYTMSIHHPRDRRNNYSVDVGDWDDLKSAVIAAKEATDLLNGESCWEDFNDYDDDELVNTRLDSQKFFVEVGKVYIWVAKRISNKKWVDSKVAFLLSKADRDRFGFNKYGSIEEGVNNKFLPTKSLVHDAEMQLHGITTNYVKELVDLSKRNGVTIETYDRFKRILDRRGLYCNNYWWKLYNSMMNESKSINEGYNGILTDEEEELLLDIANRYVTSHPISGRWENETQHELEAISDELNVSEGDAKRIMIDYLGFSEEQFNESKSINEDKPISLSEDRLDKAMELVDEIYKACQSIYSYNENGKFEEGLNLNRWSIYAAAIDLHDLIEHESINESKSINEDMSEEDYDEFFSIVDKIGPAINTAGGDMDDINGNLSHPYEDEDRIRIVFVSTVDKKDAKKFVKTAEAEIEKAMQTTRFNRVRDIYVYQLSDNDLQMRVPASLRGEFSKKFSMFEIDIRASADL